MTFSWLETTLRQFGSVRRCILCWKWWFLHIFAHFAAEWVDTEVGSRSNFVTNFLKTIATRVSSLDKFCTVRGARLLTAAQLSWKSWIFSVLCSCHKQWDVMCRELSDSPITLHESVLLGLVHFTFNTYLVILYTEKGEKSTVFHVFHSAVAH